MTAYHLDSSRVLESNMRNSLWFVPRAAEHPRRICHEFSQALSRKSPWLAETSVDYGREDRRPSP